MKIDGKRTSVERVTMDVEPWDVFNALQACSFKAAGIEADGVYVKEGMIMTEDEHLAGGNHSWYAERVVIETPSHVQLEVIEQFNALRKTLAKLNFTG